MRRDPTPFRRDLSDENDREHGNSISEPCRPIDFSTAPGSIDIIALLATAGTEVELFGDARFVDWMARQSEAWHPPLPARLQRVRLAVSIADAVAASKCRLGRIMRWPCYTREGLRFDNPASSIETTVVPCLDMAVAAGTGASLWDEAAEQWIEVPCPLPDGDFVSLKVSGDSMEPLLHNGDVVLVQKGSRVAPNDVVIARIHDDEYVVKRVGEMTSDEIELRSVNSDYASAWISGTSDQIVGRVLLSWCGHDRALAANRRSMSTRSVP